jgi:hypothetical protein
MPKFTLEQELSELHDDAISYASAIQNEIAAKGGCKSLSSEAMNSLAYNAVLNHRSVRTLCEEGWAPVAPVLNRTLLDIAANSIAIVRDPTIADHMGFKYMSDFLRKYLEDGALSDEERFDAEYELARVVNALPKTEIGKANGVINEPKAKVYFFQPEFQTTRSILKTSPHNIYDLYKMFSGVTHGGLVGKLLFDDDPSVECIEPREHPKNMRRAITASSRLLLEICYIRDHWDNHGANDGRYQAIVSRIINLI